MKEKTAIDNLSNGNRGGAISRRAFLRGTACAALAGAETLGLWTFNGESGTYACGNKAEFVFPNRVERSDSLCNSAATACPAPRPLRFMTFNIFGGGYGGFKAEERQDRAMTVVRRYAPDIVSWQEVNESWWNSPLFNGMDEYGVVRGDEDEALVRAGADLSRRQPHWVNHEPLMYRKERLTLLDHGLDFYHISLQVEKSLTWAVLEDRTDGRRFIAFATHFWWKRGPEADAIRELNARHVLCRIDAVRRKWGDLPVVGGGDFNCEKGSLAMNTFAQFGYDDAGEVAPIRSTVPSEHGALVRDAEGRCRGRIGKKGEKGHGMIDHVIVERGCVRALKHDVITDEEAIHISDHSPVVVDFEFVSTSVSAEKQP